jgi:hypothetical protein
MERMVVDGRCCEVKNDDNDDVVSIKNRCMKVVCRIT